ncbi:MAG: glycerol-3-phosphate acyltransferase [Planctomycetota bacterium]|nr:glycerol-3-phosphate acyltransferase [Planctomycetota bacterium]
MTDLIVPFLIGALAGSIPVAWILVRVVARQDVSAGGSGNVGALNASRVGRSRLLGLAVLGLDGLKGVAAVLLATLWRGDVDTVTQVAATVGAIAGHNYNPWLSLAMGRVVGGKGFAAAAGAMLVFCPWLVAAWILTTIAVWLLLRKTHGIRDEAPATAFATLVAAPMGWWLYGVPIACLGLGLAVLTAPKLVPEVRALLAERKRVDRATGA